MIAEISTEELDINKSKPDLNNDTIEEIWQAYIAFIKPNVQNAFLNIIQQQKPKIAENKIILEVSNNINLELLMLNKSTIVSYLLQHTNAKNIELEVTLIKAETEISNAPKKPRERAKELYESNESVRYLIQKFDLTLDV